MSAPVNTTFSMENVEKLTDGEGYPLWKYQLEIYLDAAGILDTCINETADDKRSEEWRRKDAAAKRLIVSTIDKQILTHILECKTSHSMWEKLKEIFERDSEHQKCKLMQEFFNYKIKKEGEIAIHLSEIKNLAFKLKALGAEVSDSMIISKILTALPEKHRNFISAWESAPALERTLTNLTARLLAEESRTQQVCEEEAAAFRTWEKTCFKCNKKGHVANTCKKMDKKSTGGEIKCFKCQRTGHIAKYCKEDKTSPMCKICKKNNHDEKDCYFRKSKTKQKTEKEETTHVAFLTGSDFSTKWIIDSGSTSHMTNNDGILYEEQTVKTEIGTADKTTLMKAEKIGSVNLQNCKLTNVLYIPQLKNNLLSVNAITRKGGVVTFKGKKATVTLDNKVVINGEQNNMGLYECDQSTEQAMITDIRTKVRTWHARLGHPGEDNLKRLTEISTGMGITKEEITQVQLKCEACILAKHARKPFKDERKRAKGPLEIIHTDVCGPITPKTWDQKRYFITFIDDYTNHVTLQLMKEKSEASKKLKQYVMSAEVKWGLPVKEIRCDNGKEYCTNEMKTWCENKGIMINYTPPHTPQLNGKAERMNRTIVEKTRAMLATTNTEKTLWGEAARTAAYLKNRTPDKINKLTAHEMWSGEKPNLEHLKIFGCKTYAKKLEQIKKLDNRSEIKTFVGYAPMGYRLWDKNRRTITISREVQFIEEPEILSYDEAKEKREAKIRTEMLNEEQEIPQRKSDTEDQKEEDESETEEWEDPLEEDIHTDEDIHEENTQIYTDEQIALRRSKRKKQIPERYGEHAYLTYEEAMKGEDKERWKTAIRQEKEALEKNKIWDLVKQEEAQGKKCLTSKWVFKIKEDNTYKARLVARGYEYKGAIEYEKLFSPVVNSAALRILFGLAAQNNWSFVKFDVKTAFLYGELTEDIYMYLPQGYEEEDKKICKLKKALYGLKQAPHSGIKSLHNRSLN